MKSEEDSNVTDIKVPDNEFFKGFWVFALWGFIPPTGFEEYKCTLISTVVKEERMWIKNQVEGRKQEDFVLT